MNLVSKKILGLIIVLLFVVIGLLLPENLMNPVKSATSKDWNHQTFWYSPWGASGVHKGIDIFGKRHQSFVAPVSGVVVFSGQLKRGGQAIAILGPKWRVHYMAHLQSRDVNVGNWVKQGNKIASLGDSGNAQGKQPHVHYSLLSLIPYPWLMTTDPQGYKRMFYLNTHEKLLYQSH